MMSTNKSFPKCDNQICFGCSNGECTILRNNNFGRKPCPFFKTKAQLAEEKKKRFERENRIEV